MSGAHESLGQLSNNELRRLGFILAAALPAAKGRAAAARAGRRSAMTDAAGFSFTIAFEVAGVGVGAALPPPFNLLLIGGAAASALYKLFDGRSKYQRVLSAWRSNARQREEAGRLKRIAAQLEQEVQLRMSIGSWP